MVKLAIRNTFCYIKDVYLMIITFIQDVYLILLTFLCFCFQLILINKQLKKK